jgi:hypothetical protein
LSRLSCLFRRQPKTKEIEKALSPQRDDGAFVFKDLIEAKIKV